MIFSSKIETDDLVVELLTESEKTAKELHKEIRERKDITLKPVYTAINQLIEAGVVYKKGTKVGLSKEWQRQVEEKLGSEFASPPLKEGQSVTYRFSSIDDSDRYWKHLTLLIRGTEPDFPVFFWFPNEMWIYLKDRGESEREYMRDFERQEKYAFMIIDGDCRFDRKFRNEYMSDYLQTELVPGSLKKRNSYITVIGDFVITTSLPKETAGAIDNLYKTVQNEEELSSALNKVFENPQKMKMRLERNQRKAQRLRKRLSKPFYIPREIREKFDLFGK